MTKLLSFLFFLLHCFLNVSDAHAQNRILSSDDFRITEQEQDLIKDLGIVIAQPDSADSQTVIEKLSLIPSPAIQKKWEQYLKEVLVSTPEMEKAIFLRVHGNYLRAIAALGIAHKQCKGNELKGATWFEDLNKKFGKAHVKENRFAVKEIIFFLQLERESACIEGARKAVLEEEWRSHSVIKENLKNIVQFYESDRLTEAEKKQMQPRLEASRLYLDLLSKANVSNLMFTRTHLQLQERVQRLPQKLVNYLSSYPEFSKPFKIDPSRDLEVLDK